MTYKHGVYISEIPTSLLPPVDVDSAIPVYIGTAPLHLSSSGAADGLADKVNIPILCYTYEEACNALGFMRDSGRWDDYTLSECIYAQFSLFGVAPAIFINVLDPADDNHKEEKALASKTITNKAVNLGADVIAETVVIKATAEGTALVAGTDYSVSYDSSGDCIVNILTGGALASASELFAGYTVLKPDAVTSENIIGGYDVTTGKYKGLELVNQIFPKFRLVPGSIVSPKFSMNSGVAAVMEAKAESISGCFKAMALIDINSGEGSNVYSDVPSKKNTDNMINALQIVSWPMATLDSDKFHLSVLLAGLLGATDADWQSIPVKSPSNMEIPIDGICTADGTAVDLTQEQANYLNGQGITTALNWINGWRFWGNRTAAYPGSTDVKDAFIPVRRMFNWISNTLITTWFQKVDFPITKRRIESIVDSINIWLNGLASREFLIGHPCVQFLESENSTEDLMDGIVRLHVKITPPSPMRELDFILEYDTEQLSTLFAA